MNDTGKKSLKLSSRNSILYLILILSENNKKISLRIFYTNFYNVRQYDCLSVKIEMMTRVSR